MINDDLREMEDFFMDFVTYEERDLLTKVKRGSYYDPQNTWMGHGVS